MKKQIALLLLLLTPGIGWSLSLSGLRTQIRYHARDTAPSASARYTDAILTSWINEVQKEVNNQTWSVEGSTTYTLIPGTTYYALPTDWVACKRAVYTNPSGMGIQLEEKTEKYVLDSNSDYERSSRGAPLQYFTRQSKTASTVQISFLPVPTTTSTGTVRLDYIAQPADLSADADIPFNSSLELVPYNNAIVYGVTLRIKLIEGKTDEAQAYSALYDKAIKVMNENTMKLPNYRPSLSGGAR